MILNTDKLNGVNMSPLTVPTGLKPLRKSFSQEEIVEAAKQWLRGKYPDMNLATRMQRLGVLIDFVTDLIPNAEGTQP